MYLLPPENRKDRRNKEASPNVSARIIQVTPNPKHKKPKYWNKDKIRLTK